MDLFNKKIVSVVIEKLLELAEEKDPNNYWNTNSTCKYCEAQITVQAIPRENHKKNCIWLLAQKLK